jgi:peroxiredoxin
MKPLLVLAALLLSAPAAFAQPAADSLKVGDVAPDFSLMWASKDSVASAPLALSSLTGERNVVLAFYPAAFSGGCTKEVCDLRDNFAALEALDAEVVGISGDYKFANHAWAKEHELPFRLLSDHRHEVGRRYASYDDATGYNKRTIYVIDRAGKVAYVDLRYSPRDTASLDKLKAALQRLK